MSQPTPGIGQHITALPIPACLLISNYSLGLCQLIHLHISLLLRKDGISMKITGISQFQAWLWKAHVLPNVVFTPFPGGLTTLPHPVKFFIPTKDGRVFERYLIDQRDNWGWINHGAPPGTVIMGRPGVSIQDEKLSPGGPQFFFYGLTNLKVQLWSWSGIGSTIHKTGIGRLMSLYQEQQDKLRLKILAKLLNPGLQGFLLLAMARCGNTSGHKKGNSGFWIHHNSPPPGLFGTFP